MKDYMKLVLLIDERRQNYSATLVVVNK